jgi:hypothetical protein
MLTLLKAKSGNQKPGEPDRRPSTSDDSITETEIGRLNNIRYLDDIEASSGSPGEDRSCRADGRRDAQNCHDSRSNHALILCSESNIGKPKERDNRQRDRVFCRE